MGNSGEISGHERDSGDAFTLRVIDNGEGRAADPDLIFFDDTADDQPCVQDDNDDDDASVALARGTPGLRRALRFHRLLPRQQESHASVFATPSGDSKVLVAMNLAAVGSSRKRGSGSSARGKSLARRGRAGASS